MRHFTAVLDANVLHSQPLTSLLLELAVARLYQAQFRGLPRQFLHGLAARAVAFGLECHEIGKSNAAVLAGLVKGERTTLQ